MPVRQRQHKHVAKNTEQVLHQPIYTLARFNNTFHIGHVTT